MSTPEPQENQETKEDETPTPKPTPRRANRMPRLMRAIHLYTGLFLSPWMLLYATSALTINHRGLLPPAPHGNKSQTLLRREEYVADESLPVEPEAQVRALLQALELDGPHNIVKAKTTPRRVVINRPSAGGHYRIEWNRERSTVAVYRTPFSFFNCLSYLHFRKGYNQPYASHLLWVFILDALIISIWLWVITGVYLWLIKPVKKPWGPISLGAGCLIFAVLVFVMLF